MGKTTEAFSLLSIYGLILGAVAAAAIAHHQINQNAAAIENINTTVAADHDVLTTIERDVRWMRTRLEKEWQR